MKNIAQLLQLEENCRNCEDITELTYIIVNETRQLVEYDQAVLITPNISGKLKVDNISDISTIDATSPFIQWIEEISQRVAHLENYNSLHIINPLDDFTQPQLTQLKDFSPSNILWIPLLSKKDGVKLEYYLILFKNDLWSENEKLILTHIASSYRYFLYGLNKCKFKTWLKQKSFDNKYIYIALILIFLLMFVPIKLTVLAPSEIQAKNPLVVTSPLNGAVDKVKVLPNQVIQKGDLIVKIKNTEYENNYIISTRTLEIAKAQLHSVSQNSFIDYTKKSQIANLKAEVKLKQAEMNFAKYQYEQTDIYAKESGIVIINDPNEWSGKPVVVGERILQIADKNNIQIKIMLPVSDAIFLNEKATVKIFFDNDPLNSFSGKISQIYYEPELTPQTILSYKIIAEFDDINENGYTPKIGLRGTAKIYSQDVSLFFYLFKKPITSIRQWVGW